MADLKMQYMGLPLKNPIIVGASGLTSSIASMKKIEESGAGALVTKSLFEEQIQLEKMKLESELQRNENLYGEMLTLFPRLEHAGPKEHLMWVAEAKKSLSLPVIASLNAVERTTWVEYAAQLAETGVDGLELNFYASPRSMDKSGAEIEDEQTAIVADVKKAVALPVAVKLSLFYTNPLQIIQRMDEAGADAFVLFNRLFQPDIDVNEEKNTFPLGFSQKSDHRAPLRFAGLLSGNIKADVCASSGIMDGEDVAKMILAGAGAVQVVTTLYRNTISHVSTLIETLKSWMEEKGYDTLDDFKGRMSRNRSKDPWIYTRSQYVKILLRAGEDIIKEIHS